MVDLIPHPFDRASFYQCVHLGSNVTAPYLQHCPELLYYDFRKGQCEFKEIAIYFDYNNEEHLRGIYILFETVFKALNIYFENRFLLLCEEALRGRY